MAGQSTSNQGRIAPQNRSSSADASSHRSTNGSSNHHASGGGGVHSGSSMQHSRDPSSEQNSLRPNQDVNHSPGTFGRQTSRNSSIHSQSNETLPSPIIEGSGSNRRSTDSATPIAGLFASTTSISKGKQKAREDANSRASIDSSRRSSVRWSGELPRLDEDLDDILFNKDSQNKYQTPLSPRIQATTSTPISADYDRRRRSFETSPRFQAQDRIGKQSNPSLGQIRDLSPDSDAAMTGRSKSYRRFEREVEFQRERQRLEGGGTLSPVSSSASPPLFALGEGKITAESNNNQSKRVKRVSLGQVSIDGVPVAIGSPIYGHANSPTLHVRTDSRTSRLSPSTNRSRARSSYGHRRLALSESSRSRGKEAKKIRKRTSSDPIVKADDPSFSSDRRLSEEGLGIFRGLLEGGRVRKRSETEGISAVSQITLTSSSAAGQKKAFSEEYLGPFPSQSSTRLPVGIITQNRAALGLMPRRNSSEMMRWDSAHATALSLGQGDHYDSMYDPRQSDLFAGRLSTSSTILMQNRNLARYHLGALISLRCRIPLHPSNSLEPIQFRSIFARIHHSLLIFQVYLHVPATIFFDYNALFTLVQVALYPDANDQSAPWWIATGIYAGCFAIWFVVILIFWEIVIQYRRRWLNDRPFALPIYLSTHAFNLTSIKSFSLHSLLYRTRFQASRRDFWIETCWFASQNWPTILTIIPRGIILTIFLVIYNPTSNENRIPLNGQIRDSVYFNPGNGLLTSFSYIVLLINTAWIACRFILLITSWIGLLCFIGPRSLLNRERSAYKDEEADISLTDFRASTSTRPLLNLSRASNVPDLEGKQEQSHPALQNSVEERAQTEGEMQQVPTVQPVIERRSINNIRPNLGSIEIPRRSHSLVRGAERPIQMASNIEELQQPIDEEHDEIRRSRIVEHDVSPKVTTTLPSWAWRARAEERLSALLLDCQLDNEIESPAEEINAWGDPLPRESAAEGTNEQKQNAHGPQNLYDSRNVTIPIISLPEEHLDTKAHPPTTTQNSTKPLFALDGTFSSVSDQHLTDNKEAGSGLGQALNLEHADKSVSSVDIGRSTAYPFPRQSEEMNLQSAILSQSPQDLHGNVTDQGPIIVPTAIPLDGNQSLAIATQSKTSPYSSGTAAKSSKKSLTGRSGIHSSSDSTSSLVESIRTALGRKSTETTNGIESARKGSNEAIRSQINVQTSPKIVSKETASPPSWWKGLFGGTSNSAPNVTVSDAVADANMNEKVGLNSQKDVPGKVNIGDPMAHPRASSPLSGIGTADKQNNDEDLLGITHSAETSNTTSNLDNIGEVGNEEVIRAVQSRHTNDEDAASFRSTSTDDSEERRIWSQFPEQSRRHPPGLIALELEQRGFSAETRLRSSLNLPHGGTQDNVSGGPQQSSSTTTDSVYISDQNADNPDSSFEGDSSFGSATHLMPSSQLEALGPIQEESWSNSHEAITDEEIELIHSEQNSSLRR